MTLQKTPLAVAVAAAITLSINSHAAPLGKVYPDDFTNGSLTVESAITDVKIDSSTISTLNIEVTESGSIDKGILITESSVSNGQIINNGTINGELCIALGETSYSGNIENNGTIQADP